MKKKYLIGAAVAIPLIVAIVLIVVLVIVPYATNKFRISVVDDIALGASKEEVREILGDPYLEEKARWGYGDDSLCSYLDDAQEISSEMEKAILRGDFERAERLNRQYGNLMDEVASKKFSYIEIKFEDDAVVSVLLDKAYALEPGYKKVEEDELTWLGGESVVLPYYIDYTQNPDGELREIDCELGDGETYSGKELSCATKFTDGSYFHAYVKSYEVKDERYIVWSDAYVDHEARKPNGFSSSISPLGTISTDGTWSSKIKFKSITIPANVTSIGDSAFENCSGLTSIEIPDSVTSIGDSAFGGCNGLASITIPDSVTSIGDSAFGGCNGLTSIKIPDSVTSIGEGAFYGTAYFNDNSNWENGTVLYIGNFLIKVKSSISGNYSIRNNTKVIGYEAFSGCSGLTSITIPDSVTSIGDYAFSNCSRLKNATIESGSIGEHAFWGCNGLTSVTIGNGVTSIGERVFNRIRDTAKNQKILLKQSLSRA